MTPPRRLAWPAYLVSFALMITPAYDAALSVLPSRLGDARWRYGAIGLLSNTMMISLTGLLLVLGIALLLDHKRMIRAVGLLGAIGAVICVVALVLFGLDALQTRGGVQPNMARSFMLATVNAAGKLVISVLALAGFAVVCLRGSKSSRGAGPRPSLIVRASQSGGQRSAGPDAESPDSPAGEA